MTLEPHASRTASGIVLPDPDQGVPVIQVQFAFPSTMLEVWEPFSDEQIEDTPELATCGHNLQRFAERWAVWQVSREAFLVTHEPRFRFPQLIPRSAIPHVAGLLVAYHRREDVRAMHRGLAVAGQPSVRALGGHAFEVTIPTR